MIATPVACPDDPRLIEYQPMCLYSVSKDFVEGKLSLVESETEQCERRGCTTLKTRHELSLEVRSSREECDSDQGHALDGRLESTDLASAFIDGNGTNRGFHGATFLWREPQSGLYITGRLSGITNAGVHRARVFEDCQRCHEPGVMQGRLCGLIRRGPRDLRGCNVIGIYLLRFEADERGGQGGVEGTFEGVIVCPCG
jgi:hypothetical protein